MTLLVFAAAAAALTLLVLAIRLVDRRTVDRAAQWEQTGQHEDTDVIPDTAHELAQRWTDLDKGQIQ